MFFSVHLPTLDAAVQDMHWGCFDISGSGPAIPAIANSDPIEKLLAETSIVKRPPVLCTVLLSYRNSVPPQYGYICRATPCGAAPRACPFLARNRAQPLAPPYLAPPHPLSVQQRDPCKPLPWYGLLHDLEK